MERSLLIRAYRNIGIKKGTPHEIKFLLNRSTDLENLGDLIILLGPNNSGKTNFLEALNSFGNGGITQRDIPEYFDSFYAEIQPELSLRTEVNNSHIDLIKKYKSNGNEELHIEIGFYEEILKEKIQKFKSIPLEELTQVFEVLLEATKYNITVYHKELKTLASEWMDSSDKQSRQEEYSEKLIKAIEKIKKDVGSKPIEILYKRIAETGKQINSAFQNLLNFYLSDEETSIKICNEKFTQKYGYNLIPNIINYKETQISGKMLSWTLSTYYDSNPFFNAVFNLIGVNFDDFWKKYKEKIELGKGYLLSSLEKDLNSKISKIADDFNKLYYEKEEKYSFSFRLETNKISFNIEKGGFPLNLDYQSTGFRWFFSLYFNLLSKVELKPGDILLMDEPGTSLHVKGQIELRAFLKKFASEHKILIVIATQSPFLVDLDYLDEIRTVQNENGVCKLQNNFQYFKDDDPDTLKSIKDSLTVGANVFFTEKSRRIFVEGVTDYNYLVAMKKLLGYKDLYFLPINGLGCKNDEKRPYDLIKELISLNRGNPTIVVDNDKAGKVFKQYAKNQNAELKVISLDEINTSFKSIESLFSETDIQKYCLKDSNGKFKKDSDLSSLIKRKIINDENLKPDEITINNFKSFFDYISGC